MSFLTRQLVSLLLAIFVLASSAGVAAAVEGDIILEYGCYCLPS